MFNLIWRWCIGWLDRQSLSSVAAVLETRAAQRGDIEAMHAAAKRALLRGDHAAALLAIEPALLKNPEIAALWCTRAIAHRLALSFEAARTDYEQAIKREPKDVRTLSNLGEWHLARSAFAEALTWLNAALAVNPDYYEARVNRVATLIEQRQLEQAHIEANNLVATHPTRPEPYGNLGNVFFAEGKLKESIEQYKKALEIRPDYAEAHFSLQILQGFSGQQELVVEYLERCIEEKGETNQRLTLLAVAYKECCNLEKAIAMSRKVIEAYPNSYRASINLAGCLSDSGKPRQSLDIYEELTANDETQMEMASNTLFERNYLSEFSREDTYKRHLAWAQKYEAPVLEPAMFDARDRNRQRKLKVGYVSADLCAHPVGFLLRDVVSKHDKGQFEIHCFSVGMKRDHTTTAIEEAVDGWTDAAFQIPEELASTIRNAEIDVLMDLSGHTGNHRLLAFARRPAPVQATWIGYFHTTGMSSMDYFITDPHTSPPDSGQFFSERAIHLPHSRFCFAAPDYAGEVAASPLAKNKFVTFGSFNRLAKLNEQVIDAWARILLATTGSRLILKAAALGDDSVCQEFVERFAACGVDASRLDLRGASDHHDMLAEYGEMDIALDPFPFNGGMTTLEALWMGVPVVTFAGNTVVSRQTFSALANIGLADELAFSDVASYVAGAVALAKNTARLIELRDEIRPLMTASPLRQSEQFTRDLEALYRRMWQAWCDGKKLASDLSGAD